MKTGPQSINLAGMHPLQIMLLGGDGRGGECGGTCHHSRALNMYIYQWQKNRNTLNIT